MMSATDSDDEPVEEDEPIYPTIKLCRSLFEKDENISEEWKIENLKKIKSRMQGWQLSTFEESYNHKINQGISLFKKKFLEG